MLVVVGEVARLAERFAWFRGAGSSTADPFTDVPAAPAAPVSKRTA